MTCLVVVVAVAVALPIEAACAVHVRNMPRELHTASDPQVVCTVSHIFRLNRADVSQLLYCTTVQWVLTSEASVIFCY